MPPRGGGSGKRGLSPVTITIAVLAALIAFTIAASNFWTEILWFNQMDAARIIWTRWGTTAILFVIGFALTALFLVVILAARGITGSDHVDGKEPDA